MNNLEPDENQDSNHRQPPPARESVKKSGIHNCHNRIDPRPLTLLLLVLLTLTGGCAGAPTGVPADAVLFSSPPPATTAIAHTPSFLVEHNNMAYNRIGTPAAREDVDGSPEIIVDPASATVYHERAEFSTAGGSYTNEIYRIHFREVPFGWRALNLTAGKNPGLLVIYTLNSANEPVLITTVHTCGCYLAFFPTTAMPAGAYPVAGWPDNRQWIYGQTLPSRLPAPEGRQQIVFTLADQTHRITWAELFDTGKHADLSDPVTAALAPMRNLYRLPFRYTTVSFFETKGPRAGYVKNNSKPLERLLIGWWAFDFRVGEDKAYGGGDDSTVSLYTSLKFWAREASNLKDFPRFLAYWGWRL